MTMTFSLKRDLQELLATVPADQPRLLVGYLSTDNKERNELAAKVFVGAGAAVVPMLVREAIVRGKRPQHRIRLLEIIARIGAPLDVSDWMTLLSGTGIYPGPVRMKIAEVLVRLGRAKEFASPGTPTPTPGRRAAYGATAASR